MAFLGLDNRNDLPKVSYSTALDYFVGTCFAFVLASIIQFAGVHYFTKHGSGEVPPIFMQYSSEESDGGYTDEDVFENGEQVVK
jgi:gamma-aminobutyric acid receptor subunit alpha